MSIVSYSLTSSRFSCIYFSPFLLGSLRLFSERKLRGRSFCFFSLFPVHNTCTKMGKILDGIERNIFPLTPSREPYTTDIDSLTFSRFYEYAARLIPDTLHVDHLHMDLRSDPLSHSTLPAPWKVSSSNLDHITPLSALFYHRNHRYECSPKCYIFPPLPDRSLLDWGIDACRDCRVWFSHHCEYYRDFLWSLGICCTLCYSCRDTQCLCTLCELHTKDTEISCEYSNTAHMAWKKDYHDRGYTLWEYLWKGGRSGARGTD